jgi:hypothetical protein
VTLVSSFWKWRAMLAAVIVAVFGLRADAQVLPSEPLIFGNGWLTVGGDLSATASCASVKGASARCTPDTGYFNYTDYEQSVLRMLIVSVSAAVRAGNRVSVLSEVRSENGRLPEPYALYVRVTPFPSRGFAIQAGRVPPTFGAFARRRYATDNLLIGYPLAYQYLTSLRPDALPADADELLAMRGRGWLSNFSVGNLDRDNGLPLVNAFRWDTGLQVHAGGRLADATVGITTGTLGNPLVGDDNNGRQISGRVALRPAAGVVAGFSAARGPFVTTDALRAAGADADARRYSQTAWGADLEYSRDYYLIRFEGILSEWRVPLIRTIGDLPLRATAASLEGRYKIQPGLYAAARVDHLSFSRIGGTARHDGWDAPVTRIEVGGGYSLQRNILLKVSFQRNSRQTSRAATVNALATQVAYWF